MEQRIHTRSIAFLSGVALVLGALAFVPALASADFGYGGPGNDRVTVCKATSSQFNPYVKVTVPEHVAERFLAEGGVYPDAEGNCPEGVSIRDYVAERTQTAMDRLAERLDRLFARLPGPFGRR